MKNNRTFLEKLLNGAEVEWKPLIKVASLTRGRVISKEYLTDHLGDYPVYSSQTVNNGEIGKINSFDFDGEFVSWTTDGANAGTVFYRSGKFSITNVCGLIKIQNNLELNYKFLFYWLSIEAKNHVYSGMGNPKLMSHQMEKILIPIPPLSVQTEIVKILDALTALTSELTSELTLRRKQYEYYREKLLSEEELGKVGFEWKTVKSLCNDNFWLMPATPEFDDNGNIPYITSKNIKGGKIDFQNTKYINEYVYQELSRTRCIIENDILISMIGTIGEAVIVKKEDLYFYGQNMYVLRLNNELVNHKFFLYYFTAPFILNSLLSKKNSSNQGYLKAGQIESLKIPIPPLPVQTKIVKILDKFVNLTNSISEGLPLAIEQSQKRYEYYRELLLSF